MDNPFHMRRRARYAQESKDVPPYYVPRLNPGKPVVQIKKPQPEKISKDVPKGVCPYCEKHIGRGVHFHARKCKG